MAMAGSQPSSDAGSADDRRGSVDTAGALRHVRLGSGEPMLLIHGLGADHRCWAPVLEPLARRFDVIAVDLPGFGDTPPLPATDPPRPARLAELVVDLLGTLEIGRAHLVGNSLGSWVALEAAVRDGAISVTSLCAAGLWAKPLLGAGKRPRRAARRLAQLTAPALLAMAGTAAGRRAMFSTTLRDGSQLSAEDARGLMSTWLTAPGYDAANLQMRRGAFTDWSAVGAPVTLAWGQRDHLVSPPRHPPSWVQTVMLAGCGHLPMWDNAELVLNTITDTVARTAPRPV
jgi:pimeloyl-ACP methyl ester carboxylesterase